MADFPRNPVVPTHIHSWSKYMVATTVRLYQTFASPGAMAWTVNAATYVPLYLPWPYNVRRLFWSNGNSVGGANADIGIYAVGGGKLYSSGATGLSGVGVCQYVTPSPDILLSPGLYFLAWASDASSSPSFGFGPSAAMGRAMGLYQQAGAMPLPASATFAAWSGTWGVPLIGITNTDAGF